MLITRETDYAIRIVRALSHQEMKTIQEICDHEQIPRQFAYKIIKKLERGRLINTRRGVHGGCLLGKKPEQITLHDIVSIMDPDFALTHCLREGYQCEYAIQAGRCGIHMELARIQGILEEELKRKRISQLI